MTQPNDLPPLPEPMRKSGQQISYDGADKAFCDMFSIEQMTAYGLQCAEAAVERERARCLLEVSGMLKTVQEATPSELLDDLRAYASRLLEFLVGRIERK